MPPPPPTPPITLFPPPPKVTLRTDTKLNNAVTTAVNALVAARAGTPAAGFALTIVDLASGSASGNQLAAGHFRPTEEHYAASVVKMGVMYAAHCLLDMVTRYNTLRSPASPEALFKGLRADMDGAIERSSTLIFGAAKREHRVPSYESVIAATKMGAKLTIAFRKNYVDDMALMIIPSNNHATARCIHGLGYGYLNGCLQKHGFFDPDAAKKAGIWVAGDFIGAWPYVRIPAVNDVDTAQGSTSAAIAHMMAVILTDNNVPAGHADMIKLLEKSAHGSDPSWFLRSEVGNRLAAAQVTHAKIGLGPLKSRRDVYSEATGLKGVVGANRRYATGFVNVDYSPYSLDDVLTVIKEAIRVYETP
jgi:hypothetical protein